jgi:adenylate kinase
MVMAAVKKVNHQNQTHVRIILLLGAPGSGKGTQSALLASRLGVTVLSTGAILREEARRDTPAGFRLRQTMAAGALVNDESVCEAVAARIENLGPDEQLILDGFPRTLKQARSLDRLLENLGMPGPLVLHLDVPGKVLLRRLASRRQCAKCGAVYNLASRPSVKGSRCQIDGGALVERDDDSEGVITRRLAAYNAETLPVVEYYVGGNYRRIDGDRAPAEIAKEVRDIAGFLAGAAVAA